MNQDIHSHLEKLKIELIKLEPAVKHLQMADENTNSLVSMVKTIHKEYSLQLQAIEKLLLDSNKDHHIQISKAIQDSTTKLNNLGDKIERSFNNAEKEVKDLLHKHKLLSTETEKLVAKIDKINFPARLDKIDSTISSINQELRNTQLQLGDLERRLKDDYNLKQKEMTSRIESVENVTKQRIYNSEKEVIKMVKNISRQNKMIKFLVIICIVLMLSFSIYKIISERFVQF